MSRCMVLAGISVSFLPEQVRRNAAMKFQCFQEPDLAANCQRSFRFLPEASREDGVSLLMPEKRRHVFVETLPDWHALSCMTVVSNRHKLTGYPGEPFGELTDLIDDPNERQNHFGTSPGVEAQHLRSIIDMKYSHNRSIKPRHSYA